jgi:anti-sigma factor RsiW
MNSAPVNEDDLHAWADGQLDAARRTRIESWFAAHPEARAEAEGWRAQNRALHDAFNHVLDEPVPARLMQAMRGGKRMGWLPRPSLAAMAFAAFWLVLGVVLGFTLRGARFSELEASFGNPGIALAREAAIAHTVYVPEVRHPVEVAADQEAHLVAWLSKRLGTALKVPQLNEAGYALVGGRLLPGAGDAGGTGPVAQFMYESAGKQRLTLYVRRNLSGEHDSGFSYVREDQLDVFYWIDGGLGFALSGNIGKSDLLHVASLVFHQLEGDERHLQPGKAAP